MTDQTDLKELAAHFERENARLRGEILATGVILTQLLQSICKTQMNPYAFATKVMKDARDAVSAFEPETTRPHDEAMKQAALELVRHYDEQIRSVLPV